MAPMMAGVAIMTFAWPYAVTKHSLIAVAVIYGLVSVLDHNHTRQCIFDPRFSVSAYVSAFGMPLYNMGTIEDVGRRMGTVMFFAALGALAGPPISGAINVSTGSIKAVSYFAGNDSQSCLICFCNIYEYLLGSTVLLAVIMMWITRYLLLKRFLGKF